VNVDGPGTGGERGGAEGGTAVGVVLMNAAELNVEGGTGLAFSLVEGGLKEPVVDGIGCGENGIVISKGEGDGARPREASNACDCPISKVNLK